MCTDCGVCEATSKIPPRLTHPLTFAQACFISGMSADTLDHLDSVLTEQQKLDFIQNERETITDEGFDLAINHDNYPEDPLY